MRVLAPPSPHDIHFAISGNPSGFASPVPTPEAGALKRTLPSRSRQFIWGRTAGILLCFFIQGCGTQHAIDSPSIQFTRIPPTAPGGPDKLDIIEGRVNGARPDQQIVLYARSGAWWVQPLANLPYTPIGANSKWTNSTHLGTEYAALLVNPGFRPEPRINELPAPGGGVAAVAKVKGAEATSSVSKTLQFSGYEWRIREAPSDRGGLNNYDASNAWTDARGALHLRIAKTSKGYSCAEVTLTRSLGYGSYSFVVEDTSRFEPADVFSIFTWDYAGGADQNFREMDIEVSRWGDPASKNAQFVVQPFYIPANVARFVIPSGVLTYSLHWNPGRASFRTVLGPGTEGKSRVVSEHTFTSGVPSPGIETVRLNLYVFHGANNLPQNGAEVVIEKFEYLP